MVLLANETKNVPLISLHFVSLFFVSFFPLYTHAVDCFFFTKIFPEIHIKKFEKPKPRSSNKCVRNAFPFVEQMYTNAFNSFGYAAMRKLFIVRHNLDNNFDFFKHVSEGLSHDFAEVLGIQWWMWFVAIAQILAEGYALPAVGAYISLFISLTVGWKLVFISEELTMSLANHYDTDGDGTCRHVAYMLVVLLGVACMCLLACGTFSCNF